MSRLIDIGVEAYRAAVEPNGFKPENWKPRDLHVAAIKAVITAVLEDMARRTKGPARSGGRLDDCLEPDLTQEKDYEIGT